MKVRNKATGEVGHAANNDQTIISLIQVGILEVVNDPPSEPIPTEPQCGIRAMPGSEAITVKLPTGATLFYDGPADKAATGFQVRRWDGPSQSYIMAGPVPPDDVLARYKALKGSQLREAAAMRRDLEAQNRAEQDRQNAASRNAAARINAALREGNY